MTWGTTGVTVRMGDATALDHVDLEIDPGAITSVVGGDGAGKTTLARTMVGLVRPSAGEVRRPNRLDIGYQSAASGVWGDLTVAENLDFVAAAHGIAGHDRASRIDELLQITRLGPARNRLAGRLSGGMRQKLGVAMALLPHPRLLVLDEPTTGLDPVSRTELWSVISATAASGTAVMFTTTYLDEAERAAEVLALEAGRMLASGEVEEVRTSLQGTIGVVDSPDGLEFAWRRGRSWRAWFPDGHLSGGAEAVEPDLSDLVIVAAFNGRRSE